VIARWQAARDAVEEVGLDDGLTALTQQRQPDRTHQNRQLPSARRADQDLTPLGAPELVVWPIVARLPRLAGDLPQRGCLSIISSMVGLLPFALY
jgi:hypothetical protein